MTYLFISLFLIFVFFFLRRKHETIIAYGMMSILFQPYMCIKYNAPALSIKFLMDFFVVLMAFKNKSIGFKTFPFRGIFIILFLSWIFAIFISPLDTLSLIPGVFQRILSFLVIVVVFTEVKYSNDVNLMIKFFLITCFILISVGIMEFASQKNVFLDYVYNNVPFDALNGKLYHSLDGFVRFGGIRCQSLFAISISWGGFCCLLLGIFIILREKIKNSIGNITYWGLFILAIICTITSGTRSCFVFLVIVLFPFIFLDKSNRRYRFFYIAALVIALMLFSDKVTELLDSFSSKTDVSGSNAEMRQNQLLSVIKTLGGSLIWGFGFKGYSVAIKANDDILGAESIWLQLLLQGGIIAVVIQLFLYIYIIKYFVKFIPSNKRIISMFFLTGWIIFVSMTSSPGLDDDYFILLILMVIKYFNSIKISKQ